MIIAIMLKTSQFILRYKGDIGSQPGDRKHPFRAKSPCVQFLIRAFTRHWTRSANRSEGVATPALLYSRTHARTRPSHLRLNSAIPSDPQSAVMPQYVVCLSVCLSVRPSVTFRYRDHIGWNTSKITSRLLSLRSMLGITPAWAIWCNGNTPKIRVK